MNGVRCQSCGMQMVEGFGGSEKDSSMSKEYCKFCFQDGEFVMPDLTMEDMIQLSKINMVEDMSKSIEDAERLAREFIPKLKRWMSS